MSEKSTEVAKLEPTPTALDTIFGQLATYTSLDLTSDRGKQLYLTAMMDPTHRVAEFINRDIEIVDLIAHEVEMEDEDTGEIQKTARIVLIDSADRSYGCVSWWISRSLSNIMAVCGRPPFNPGVIVQVTQREMGDKRRKLLLIYKGRSNAAPKSKK